MDVSFLEILIQSMCMRGGCGVLLRRAKKLLNLRLFENPNNGNKPWDSSVKDLDLEILCVSQVRPYTIYNCGICWYCLTVVHSLSRAEGQQA